MRPAEQCQHGQARLRGFLRRWRLIFPAAAWLLFPAAGRPAPVAGAGAPVQEHETEGETIAKCLRDMNSRDVARRRRAILILGKYRNPAARRALEAALADADAEVRRSALVSLSEQSPLPYSARSGVLRLLRDPDVHIRRIASSMLPELIATPIALAMSRMRGRSGAAPVFSGAPSLPLKPLVALLNQALGDKDAVVRKNILEAGRYLPSGLDPARVVACFRDPDRNIRILALQAYRRLPGSAESRVAALQSLVRDPEALVRREVARTLGRCGPAGVPSLLTLAVDAAPEVRLEAIRQLAQQEAPEAFDLLVTAVRDKQLPGEDRAGLVSFFAIYPGRAAAALEGLLKTGDLPVQAAALEVLALFPPTEVPTSTFLPYIEAESRGVRRAAVIALGRRRRELDAATLHSLLDNRFADVRSLAVRLAGSLPPAERGELLFDACLDDDPGIRRDALRQIGTYRPEGWERILKQSLADDDPTIRRTAVDALLAGRDPAGRRIVAAFLKTCDDPELAQLIRLRLGRLTPRPPGLPKRRVLPRRAPAPVGPRRVPAGQ